MKPHPQTVLLLVIGLLEVVLIITVRCAEFQLRRNDVRTVIRGADQERCRFKPDSGDYPRGIPLGKDIPAAPQ